MQMLKVENLMVFFENALALNDFSMSVDEGQLVGVIGSNSAGKTTLMNTLSGLILDMQLKERRRGGERITIYGKIIYRGEEISNFHPSERVKKGIVLCRERHPVFAESKAGFLSGGEQQMLAIGMALVAEPTLLLLDEPLLGLSPMMQNMLVDAIKRLRSDSGITVVMSEQFARPVLPIIDHGYIIENGMLTLSGTGQELMDNPEVRAAYFGV